MPEQVLLCSGCGGRHLRQDQRYCLMCHAAYMREWRKTHKLDGESLRKANVRSYAGAYKRRGRLSPEVCQVCGDERSQMHHEDYDKPLDVTWLCRPCHMDLHYGEGANA